MANNTTSPPATASANSADEDFHTVIREYNKIVNPKFLNNTNLADLIIKQRKLMELLTKSIARHNAGTAEEVHRQQLGLSMLLEGSLGLASILAIIMSDDLQRKQSRIEELEEGMKKLLNAPQSSEPQEVDSTSSEARSPPENNVEQRAGEDIVDH